MRPLFSHWTICFSNFIFTVPHFLISNCLSLLSGKARRLRHLLPNKKNRKMEDFCTWEAPAISAQFQLSHNDTLCPEEERLNKKKRLYKRDEVMNSAGTLFGDWEFWPVISCCINSYHSCHMRKHSFSCYNFHFYFYRIEKLCGMWIGHFIQQITMLYQISVSVQLFSNTAISDHRPYIIGFSGRI